ncbi:MAG: gamma-glutamyltransferase [Planctomycetota bacterium]|nr:gamma-glutamyltransferase [Planctomycetota bacterium]
MDRRAFLKSAALLAGNAHWLRAADEAAGQAPAQKLLGGQSLCVAPDARVAEVGAQMLRRGGNAFDAIVAAGFYSAVVQPAGSGIGGYAGTGVAFSIESSYNSD